jgi:hypothetical protein
MVHLILAAIPAVMAVGGIVEALTDQVDQGLSALGRAECMELTALSAQRARAYALELAKNPKFATDVLKGHYAWQGAARSLSLKHTGAREAFDLVDNGVVEEHIDPLGPVWVTLQELHALQVLLPVVADHGQTWSNWEHPDVIKLLARIILLQPERRAAS